MEAASLISLLIVDDESAHVQALCHTLADQGYAPVGCTSGEEALDVLRGREFDILLTDLRMPGMDGIALLRAALEIQPHIAGVLMTGHGSIDTAVEAMKVGALDYILKPFRLSAALPVLNRAAEMKRLRSQNAALEGSLRARAAELEAANADLEAFSASVAHDLRNPLAVIAGYASLLHDSYAPAMPRDAVEIVGDIQDVSAVMKTLIDDLLRFSRLGRQPLSLAPLAPKEIVERLVRDLSAQHAGRVVEVQVDDLPPCIGDAPLIGQVYANLLSNAFKFTRGKGGALIRIGYERGGSETVYFVSDNGAGFDKAKAKNMFGVFQRFHSEEQFEGTGLGLSIVHRIVQRHGGRIWADAEVGKGATFYFTLTGAAPTAP